MFRGRISFLCLLLLAGTGRADAPIAEVVADPPTLTLNGPNARYSLLIHGKTADGNFVDLTRAAKYRSKKPAVAAVTLAGLVRGVGDGEAAVVVEAAGRTLTVPVRVAGSGRPRSYHFVNDVEPLFGRFGCNASGCHGKAEGQNGFKLSVFGFDPPADYAALVKEARGRRIFPAAPEHSLLLLKASGGAAHGGGNRIPAGSEAYETIRGWIAAGAPVGDPNEPSVASIRVEPGERVLRMRGQQQLRVVARYADGREVDVTRHARFQCNNEAVALVSADGLVTAGDVPGEAAVMASFANEVSVFRLIVPRAERVAFPKLPANNFIDPLVDAKLRKLNVVPSGACDDAEFLRRVYLDVIGTLPTADEARKFLADKSPDRRAKLVDSLLERPEYADYWALKWADVLRVDRAVLGHRRAYAYYRWVRESIAANKPFDRFARELVTAEGPLDEVAPANFYRVTGKPGESANTLSQVFLGVRIACAECHHHPFDRWAQNDYYGMAAFFTPVGVRKVGPDDALLATGDFTARNPRSGENVSALPLGDRKPELPLPLLLLGAKRPPVAATGDRRLELAEWMTRPENPFFARNLANRYWAHFLGRGLVEPIDDVRATNPPTNPELLDALAKHVVESKYDLKQLIRTITASRAYRTSAKPNATNTKDEQNYSRALLKRVDAEVLLDMVCQTTGVPEKFPGVPSGYRAVQLWDSKVNHYFLKLFGRPSRVSACECERNAEPNVAQVLHFLNSPEVQAKLSHEAGTVAKLVRRHADDGRLVEELYLTFYARFPDDREKAVGVAHLRKDPSKRRQAAEDLAWSLLNSLEFVFNH